jgi:hypothetical protein
MTEEEGRCDIDNYAMYHKAERSIVSVLKLMFTTPPIRGQELLG